jgi:cystathionine beta-lyase
MKKDTQLVHSGRGGDWSLVNAPVSRATTVLHKRFADFEASWHEDRFAGLSYGLHGTHTAFALEEALTALEGSHRTILLPSGLAAITTALLGCVRSGDHVLMADSAYGPTRKFCDQYLTRYGVQTTYYDPRADAAAIEALMRSNTRVVYCESPGSLTFEMQDIPAIAAVAHRHDAAVLMDNTWATPYYFDALAHGVDLSIQAGTKYIGGHSDVLVGSIAANERWWRPVRDLVADYGYCISPDDCYLALRGLRTLGVRLRTHQESALKVARWLRERSEVAQVLHPALEGDPGHALWRRDFTGASGLFGVEFKLVPQAALAAFFDSLKLFGIGVSWGGYESLIVTARYTRTASSREFSGPLIRLAIGLEDVDDLIADLDQGFAAMAKVL